MLAAFQEQLNVCLLIILLSGHRADATRQKQTDVEWNNLWQSSGAAAAGCGTDIVVEVNGNKMRVRHDEYANEWVEILTKHSTESDSVYKIGCSGEVVMIKKDTWVRAHPNSKPAFRPFDFFHQWRQTTIHPRKGDISISFASIIGWKPISSGTVIFTSAGQSCQKAREEISTSAHETRSTLYEVCLGSLDEGCLGVGPGKFQKLMLSLTRYMQTHQKYMTMDCPELKNSFVGNAIIADAEKLFITRQNKVKATAAEAQFNAALSEVKSMQCNIGVCSNLVNAVANISELLRSGSMASASKDDSELDVTVEDVADKMSGEQIERLELDMGQCLYTGSCPFGPESSPTTNDESPSSLLAKGTAELDTVLRLIVVVVILCVVWPFLPLTILIWLVYLVLNNRDVLDAFKNLLGEINDWVQR